jgi:hypothetical protein
MQATSQPPNLSAETPTLNNIEELTISIVIKNLNPTMLSHEFLTMSGIVPTDWELARQPVVNPRGSQVSYKNGVNVIAQPNTISFVEAIGNKNLQQLQFAQIAQKYVEKMSNADYQGLSISPKIIAPFPEEDGGKKFINNTLLGQGAWRDFGTTSPQAAMELFYQLEDCQLGLKINPARLQQPNDQVISAVLFAGNFAYNLTNIAGEEKIKKVTQKINSWDQDLNTFRELIYEKFLQKAVPQATDLFGN